MINIIGDETISCSIAPINLNIVSKEGNIINNYMQMLQQVCYMGGENRYTKINYDRIQREREISFLVYGKSRENEIALKYLVEELFIQRDHLKFLDEHVKFRKFTMSGTVDYELVNSYISKTIDAYKIKFPI